MQFGVTLPQTRNPPKQTRCAQMFRAAVRVFIVAATEADKTRGIRPSCRLGYEAEYQSYLQSSASGDTTTHLHYSAV